MSQPQQPGSPDVHHERGWDQGERAGQPWPGRQSQAGPDGPAWTAPPPRPAPPEYPSGQPGRSGRGFTMAAVAVAAAVAAAIVTLIVVRGPSGTPASASAPPHASAPAFGGPGGFGGGSGGGGGGGTLFMAGNVEKVSATSITLGGQVHRITAAITSATKFTGVSGPSQIKPGDPVSAEITGYASGHPVAAAIQDPAQIP